MTFSAKDYLNQINSFYHKQAFYDDKLNVEYTSYKLQPIYEYSSGFHALNSLKANANSLSLQSDTISCISNSLNMFGYLMRIQSDLLIPLRTIEHLNKDVSDALLTLAAMEKQLSSETNPVKKHLIQLDNTLTLIQTVVKNYTNTSTIRPADFQVIETTLSTAASLVYYTITCLLSQE